jgi:hypothetical protein
MAGTIVKLKGAAMKTRPLLLLAMVIGFCLTGDIAAANDESPVKMSKSGICHERGSTYYSKTKNYTAYNTLEECLQAGGRKPKR